MKGMIIIRLWHQSLISRLPRQQLLGQHRECCALRGNGWGRKHATVNYVFNYRLERLVAYHYIVMDEMIKRGYKPDDIWRNASYRGSKCASSPDINMNMINDIYNLAKSNGIIYPEHDDNYLKECIENLKSKGVII